MKIGFKNPEYEKRINENFDFYIEMIKNSEPGTKEFNFASCMLRNQIDFMTYNFDRQIESKPLECVKQEKIE